MGRIGHIQGHVESHKDKPEPTSGLSRLLLCAQDLYSQKTVVAPLFAGRPWMVDSRAFQAVCHSLSSEGMVTTDRYYGREYFGN